MGLRRSRTTGREEGRKIFSFPLLQLPPDRQADVAFLFAQLLSSKQPHIQRNVVPMGNSEQRW